MGQKAEISCSVTDNRQSNTQRCGAILLLLSSVSFLSNAVFEVSPMMPHGLFDCEQECQRVAQELHETAADSALGTGKSGTCIKQAY